MKTSNTFLKRIYLPLLALLVLSFSGSAQTILYHENFSGDIQGTLTYNNTWYIATAADRDFTPNTLALSSKQEYARTSNAVATPAKTLILFDSINTEELSSLYISWHQYRNVRKTNGTQFTEPVKVYFTTDNSSTRTLFYTSTNSVNEVWNKVNNGNLIPLPATALGQKNLKIELEVVYTLANGEKDPYYAIDDLTLSGELTNGYAIFDWSTRPNGEDPFVVSGLDAADPYEVDGVTMRWSFNKATGVVHDSVKVSDSSYKKGVKSFALMQRGATATAGTTIQMQLSTAVQNLSFTLLDVDYGTNQFADKITVKGYYQNKEVTLKKTNIVTTSFNEVAGAGIIRGKQVSDNASSEGNVVVTFTEPVDRIVLEYYNDAPGTVNNGLQGVGISNFSWRYPETGTITPMPVELLSFKAKYTNGVVKLSWATASEYNNNRFEVEHSTDGRNFTTIGEVAGNGNSNSKLTYSFTDEDAKTGINYYRLRQVDHDGAFEYSKTVALKVTASSSKTIAQVYPTVATTFVTVDIAPAAGACNITITDAAGRQVAQLSHVAGNGQQVSTQNLSTGVYFVTITNNQTRETYRILKK